MTLQEAAKAYFDLGLNIVVTKDKKALVKWEKWQTQRQTFEEFETQPWQNADGFAVICGTQLKNGLFLAVIDKDVKNLPLEIVEKGTKALKDFPITQTEKTPSGGLHLVYFSRKKPKSISAYHNNYGLELFGENKYCIMAPSQGYSRLNDNSPTEIDDLTEIFYNVLGIKADPQVWFDRKDLSTKPYKGKTPPCVDALFKGTSEGLRNEYAIRIASFLANFRKSSPEKVLKVLHGWNKFNSPPLDSKEIETIVKSALTGGYVYGCNDAILKSVCNRENCSLASQGMAISLTPEEVERAEKLLEDPKLLDYVLEFGRQRLIGEDKTLLCNFVAIVSGQTRYPISEIITGFSGAGKNESLRAIKDLIPKEWIYEFTTATPEAVKYIPEEFAGTLLIFEASGIQSRTGTLGLRAIGEGESIETIYPMRDEATGRMEMGRAKTNAKNFITTESDVDIQADLFRRTFRISMSDNTTLTKRVIAKKIRDAMIPESLKKTLGMEKPLNIEDFRNALIINDWKAEVIVFSPEDLTHIISLAGTKEQEVALRTHIDKILNFVKVLTLINQKRRPCIKVGENKYVIATPEDFLWAMQTLEPTLNETITRIEKRQHQILELFKTHSQLTKNDVAQKIGFSTRVAARSLKVLAKAGYLREIETTKPYTYELIREEPKHLAICTKANEYRLFWLESLKKLLNTLLPTCQKRGINVEAENVQTHIKHIEANLNETSSNTHLPQTWQDGKTPSEPKLNFYVENGQNHFAFGEMANEKRQAQK